MVNLMKLKQKIVENGFFRTFFSIYTYFRHHLIEKWKFVYFELDLGSPPFSLPDRDSSLKIRKANYRDIEKILLYFGFERVQAKGSHVKFKSYYYKLDISIPVHRGDCKIGYKWEAQQIVRKIWKK